MAVWEWPTNNPKITIIITMYPPIQKNGTKNKYSPHWQVPFMYKNLTRRLAENKIEVVIQKVDYY